ncbi:prepilin [Lysobacteraceae bacterium NML95-0200]|nr:prepilin [Xanthomonadaceae bacterium NML95-0200]
MPSLSRLAGKKGGRMLIKHTQYKSGQQQAGFSLVELAVTVAVLAIIAGIAVPSFRNMLQRSRLTASSNEMLAVFQSARMEALRTNSRVDVCPSTNGNACGGGSWKRMIMVANKNGTSTVLRDIRIDAANIDVLSSNSISTNRVWYLPDGFVRMGNANTPVQVGALRVCTKDLPDENARDIHLNMGRVSITRVTNTACDAPGNS